MPFDADGTFSTRDTAKVLDDLIAALRTKFTNPNVTPTGTFRKILEAAVLLPLAETEAVMDNIVKENFFESASADNLDKILEPFGYIREPATRATGTVNITLSASKSDSDFNPMFTVGDLVFVDTAGRKYDMTANVVLGSTPTTSATCKVQARDLGDEGNIDASSIVAVQFGNQTASSRWSSNVSTFTNSAAFTGGQDKETDRSFRERVRTTVASKPGSSIDGLIQAVEAVSGVSGVSGKENIEDLATQDNKVFDSNQTGTASETIDGTTTRIAQKMVLTERRFIQFFNAKLASDSSLVCDVRLETDSSGSASGTLAHASLVKTGFDFDGTNLTAGTFPTGAYVAAGTYWLVFTRTSGSGTFDGGTGGTADQVKKYDGSWALSSTVENLNCELIGGIPPHGFRIYASGGAVNDIAKAIWENKPAGIPSDGITSGTVTDRSGVTQTIYFERPTQLRLYVEVTVTKSADFSGDADAIKDIIIAYIGGTDTKGVVQPGLGVGQKFIRNELISRLLDDDIIGGTVDVTVLKVDTVTPPVQTSNLTAAFNEEFVITEVADITVTLQDAV